MNKLIDAEPILSYIEYLKNCGLGKSRSLKYLTEYIECMSPAYDVDKVIEKIDKDINWYQFLKDNLKCNGTVITSDRGIITTKQAILQNVKDIVKAGEIDERDI